MKFEFNVHTTTEAVDGVINALITKTELFIRREEIIEHKEKDANSYCQTLRSIIYMYHYPHGYVTQMTDDTMYQIYDYLLEHNEYKGAMFQIIQKEIIKEGETMSNRAQSIELDLFYV